MTDVDPNPDSADIEATAKLRALAATRVSALLSALNVGTVVHVDDQYANPIGQGVEAIATAMLAHDDVNVAAATILAGTDVDTSTIDLANAIEVSDLLTQEWAHLGPETRLALTQAANAEVARHTEHLTEAQTAAEMAGPLTLIELVGQSATLHRLTRGMWMGDGDSYFDSKKRTLVLFDRDFSNEGNNLEDAGEQLLRDLLQRELPDIATGLLTKYADNEKEELKLTKELQKNYSAKPSAVVAIGKYRTEKGAETFAEALRLLLLADEIESLRQLTLASIDASAAQAKSTIEKTQRYAIVATIAAANEEGVYEPDGLMRIAHTTFQRSLTEAHRDDAFAKATLPALRDAAAIKLYQESAGTGRQLADILWDDQFVSGDYLSRLGLPIEIGDLFEMAPLKGSGAPSAGTRIFILLTQACDLSVRSDGSRSDFISEFVLHEFRPMPLDATGKVKQDGGRMQKVGKFVSGREHIYGVDFAKKVTVPDIAVDATVGTADGKAIIAASEHLSGVLSAGWVERRKALQKQAASMVRDYEKFEKSLPEKSGSQIKGQAMFRIGASIARATVSSKAGVTSVIDTTAGSVAYGITRIGRVVGPTAIGLFSLSASHHARPAFEAAVVR